MTSKYVIYNFTAIVIKWVTLVDDHEVGLPILVHLADAAQEEPDAGVLEIQKHLSHSRTVVSPC